MKGIRFTMRTPNKMFAQQTMQDLNIELNNICN